MVNYSLGRDGLGPPLHWHQSWDIVMNMIVTVFECYETVTLVRNPNT